MATSSVTAGTSAGRPSSGSRARFEGIAPEEATRLFVTPAAEVEVTCRLTLAHYLRLRMPDTSWPVDMVLRPRTERAAVAGMTSPASEAAASTLEALEPLKIVDPACGEGHFLMGMLDVLDELAGQAAEQVGIQDDRLTRRRRIVERNLYGVEVQLSAVVQAKRNLSVAANLRQELGQRPDPATASAPSNVLHGDSLVERPGFSWENSFSAIGPAGFDLVIGNPPYLRHEQIADPLGLLPAHSYKREAVSCVERRLPTFFGSGRRLDRRSDLCTLFTFLGLSLLCSRGALGFVLPIAALDAQYGRALREYLESTGRDIVILESSTQRSFAAGVNTIVLTVSGARQTQSSMRHVSLAGPLERLNLHELSIAAPPTVQPSPRAGSVRLLDRLAGQMTALESLGALRYPVKTGINRFFYPTPAVIERFAIESEFCRPVLRSPRSVRSISVGVEQVETQLFICDRSPEELESQGKWGALAYIRWGAEQRSQSGLPFPAVPSVQGRRQWYSVPLPSPADIVCPRFFDRRFFLAVPEAPLLVDQTFYGLQLSEEHRALKHAIGALLNCSLAYLAIELHGRTGLGDGVRQYALCDMAGLPVPNVGSIPADCLPDLYGALSTLSRRPIAPIEEEVRQADRLALDAVVADALGLSEDDMGDARDLLVELTDQRRRRASSLPRSSRAIAS